MNSLFVYLLIIHFVADYYLQSDELANEKKMKFAGIAKHCAIYSMATVVFAIPIWSTQIVWYFLGASLIHFAIDSLKFIINKMSPEKYELHEVSVYFLDQGLHIVTILIVSKLITNNDVPVRLIFEIGNYVTLDAAVLKSVLAFVLIFKPVNITFKMAYSHVKDSIPETIESDIEASDENVSPVTIIEDQHNQEASENEKELNVGGIIGNLERLLVLILLSVNGHSAIGLIFAAKSITRYNQIANSKEFAEYYLLGTLYSILATIIIYQSIFVWTI